MIVKFEKYKSLANKKKLAFDRSNIIVIFRHVSRAQNKIINHMIKIVLSELGTVQLFGEPSNLVRNILINEHNTVCLCH